MNRIKLLFALSASVAVLANQACNSSSPPRSQLGSSPAAEGSALTATTMSLRIDANPAAPTNQQFAVDVSFRDPTGQLLDVGDLVTIGLATNPTAAALQGTTSVTAVHGVARFTDLAISTVGQGYQLSASSTPAATSIAAAPATSAGFKVAWSEDSTTTNLTLATAQPISPFVPMFGTLGAGEVRFFKFHAKAGQLVSIASLANRLDLGNWDTSLRLRLIAPNGTTEIARSNAGAYYATQVDNGFALLSIPTEGDYFLACDADVGAFLSGKYAVILTTVPGSSVPMQTEIEPWGATGQNDTIATAQPLLPGLLYGHYDTVAANPTASDFYRIAVATPSRIRVDIVAARNGAAYGSRLWDPRLELQDASGAVLWANEDTSFRDSAIDFIVTTPGTYFVRVTRTQDLGNTGSSPYLLSYQPLPYSPVVATAGHTTAATAVPIQYGVDVQGSVAAASRQFFSFTGTAGDVIRLVTEDRSQLQNASLTINPVSTANSALLASNGTTPLRDAAGFGSATESKLNVRQTILQATGTYFVRVNSATAGTFGIRLERIAASAREVEPNDSAALATPIDATGWISGAIGAAGDVDHFKVHAEAGQLVTVALLAAGSEGILVPTTDWGSALIPQLSVSDLQGNLLSTTSADRKGETNFAEIEQRSEPMIETSFRAPAAGDYDVAVSDADGQGGATYFYALHTWKNQ